MRRQMKLVVAVSAAVLQRFVVKVSLFDGSGSGTVERGDFGGTRVHRRGLHRVVIVR